MILQEKIISTYTCTDGTVYYDKTEAENHEAILNNCPFKIGEQVYYADVVSGDYHSDDEYFYAQGLIKKINSDGKSVQIGYSTIPIDKVYKYTQQNHIELHHTYTYKWPLHTGDIITLRETFITNNKHVKLSTKYTVIKIIFQLGMEDEYYIFNDNDDLICFHENDFYFVSRSK